MHWMGFEIMPNKLMKITWPLGKHNIYRLQSSVYFTLNMETVMFSELSESLRAIFSLNPKTDSTQLKVNVISGAPNSCTGLKYPISGVGWISVLLVLPLLACHAELKYIPSGRLVRRLSQIIFMAVYFVLPCSWPFIWCKLIFYMYINQQHAQNSCD